MRIDSANTLGGASLDVAAVRTAADRIAAVAEMVDAAVRNHLSRLIFSGACAGRDHAARGEALRTGLDRLAAEVSQWSRASAEIAVALRAGAKRYVESDLYAAARIA